MNQTNAAAVDPLSPIPPPRVRASREETNQYIKEFRRVDDNIVIRYRPRGWWNHRVDVRKSIAANWEAASHDRKWLHATVSWLSSYDDRDEAEEPSPSAANANFAAALLDAMQAAGVLDAKIDGEESMQAGGNIA